MNDDQPKKWSLYEYFLGLIAAFIWFNVVMVVLVKFCATACP